MPKTFIVTGLTIFFGHITFCSSILLFKVFASLKLCYIAADVDGVIHDLQLDLDVSGAGAGAKVIAEVAVTGSSFYALGSVPSPNLLSPVVFE